MVFLMGQHGHGVEICNGVCDIGDGLLRHIGKDRIGVNLPMYWPLHECVMVRRLFRRHKNPVLARGDIDLPKVAMPAPLRFMIDVSFTYSPKPAGMARGVRSPKK